MAFEDWNTDENGNITLHQLVAYATGTLRDGSGGLVRLEYAVDEKRRSALQIAVSPQQAVALLNALRMVTQEMITALAATKGTAESAEIDACLRAETEALATNLIETNQIAQDQTATRLCDLWQRSAAGAAEEGFDPAVIAETMFSAAVAGWIGLEGERAVARRLYLLALQLTNQAQQREAQAEAQDATHH